MFGMEIIILQMRCTPNALQICKEFGHPNGSGMNAFIRSHLIGSWRESHQLSPRRGFTISGVGLVAGKHAAINFDPGAHTELG